MFILRPLPQTGAFRLLSNPFVLSIDSAVQEVNTEIHELSVQSLGSASSNLLGKDITPLRTSILSLIKLADLAEIHFKTKLLRFYE